MKWTAVTLSRAEIDAGAWKRLQDDFEKVFVAGLAPPHAAIFNRGKPAGSRLSTSHQKQHDCLPPN